MNILIGGASGFVGRALVEHLSSADHQVTRLVRTPSPKNSRTLSWNPAASKLSLPVETRFDAVIHLGGANIAEGRWTRRRKRELRESRLISTALLARTLAAMPAPPKVFACASAIGVYGNRGDEELTEASSLADDFLGKLGQDWEAATEPARAAGIRIVNLRFGLILSRTGGALQKMLPPFQLGLGGRIGDGRQFMSWISLRDTVRAIEFCLMEEQLEGPVNVVSPSPVTNRDFTQALGRSLHRPTLLPLPAMGARLLFGEMANATLLASTRVMPTKLTARGFEFADGALQSCFADF